MKCIYCEETILKVSKEHIIQNALGGELQSEDICCDECNNKRRGDNLAHYIKPFIICIILFAIGYNIEILGPDHGFGAYMLMCAYGGWKAINQFVPMIFVWFTLEAVFWHYLIKLAISMFLGFFITPVYLVYCLYKIVRLIIKR